MLLMLLTIASLRQPTYKPQFFELRGPGQSITDYVSSELNARVEYVRRKIRIAAKAAATDHDSAECLFFTLPEFFWNIPWREVDSEEELQELTTAYLDKVTESVFALMKDLPVERYGKIVLLAGSCATLIKVGEGESSYYDVINYVLAISNKEYEVDKPLMSMWPKRNVSGIDFGQHVSSEAGFWYFKLFDEFVVKVRDTSSVSAEHSYFAGYDDLFINSLVPGCPFGINLCLDYAVLREGQRDEEVEIPEVKIDFLIACGMSFDDNKQHPISIQYAIRNDGMGSGECEVVKLENGVIIADVPAQEIDDNIYLSAIHIV
jgi:hypothetical protein